MNVVLLTFFMVLVFTGQSEKTTILNSNCVKKNEHFQNLKPIIVKNNNFKITYEKTPFIIEK